MQQEKSAEIIIWLVKHAREEHRAAIEWLNNHTSEKIGFFFNNTNFANNFGRRKPSKNHWLNFFIGSSECHIAVLQIRRDDELIVELHINDNKDLFNELFQSKDNIESESGLNFEWLDLPEKKASKILIKRHTYFNDRSQWPSQFEWLVEVMIKIKQAFGQFL